MGKIKVTLAVMLAGLGVWSLASILSDSDTQQTTRATFNQVNTYELMSSSKSLPVQTYESF